MPLTTGQTLQSRYRVAHLIGQGGFGAVYRVWDLRLNRIFALKENLDTTPEAQRQFVREATTLATLQHPNLPRVIDHFSLPNQGQYLVMDFIEGQSLSDLLKQRGQPFTPQEIKPWIEQVVDALTYLHGLNPPIIHRDIKPDNIIITPQGRAVLVDFGISKQYDSQQSTTIGAKAITPGYSPPEQYGGGKTDARTDVYALGATLYELLTAVTPPASVDRIAGQAQLVNPTRYNKQIGQAMIALLGVSLQLDARRRFQTMGEFRDALQGKGIKTLPSPATKRLQNTTKPVAQQRPLWETVADSIEMAADLFIALIRRPAFWMLLFMGFFMYGVSQLQEVVTSLGEQVVMAPTIPSESYVPPANTATPVATATTAATITPPQRPRFEIPIDQYQQNQNSPLYLSKEDNDQPNCNWAGLAGAVFVSSGGYATVSEHQVHIWSVGLDARIVTGTAPQYGRTGWELYIASQPTAQTFQIQLETVDGETASEVYTVSTRASCDQNLLRFDFIQR